MPLTRERHEHQVDRIQHQLDRHEDHDDVAAYQHAHRTDGEHDGPKDQVPGDRHRAHTSVRLAKTTAPTMATNNSTEVTSNASKWCVKRRSANSSVLPKAGGSGPLRPRAP